MINLPDGSHHCQAACLKHRRHCLRVLRNGIRIRSPARWARRVRGGRRREAARAPRPWLLHPVSVTATTAASTARACTAVRRQRRRRRPGAAGAASAAAAVVAAASRCRVAVGVRLHRGHAGWGRRLMGPAADDGGGRRGRRRLGADGGGAGTRTGGDSGRGVIADGGGWGGGNGRGAANGGGCSWAGRGRQLMGGSGQGW